jgi:RimJ/RimL family protein N-acetyltransferase
MIKDVRLVSVYSEKKSPDVLYALLKERDKKINISHRALPTFKEHRAFIRKKPYKCWFLVYLPEFKEYAGSIYLSSINEIGVFVFKKFRGRGIGQKAIEALMTRYKGEPRFLANINPANARSIALFRRLGFRHIQNTYELRNKKR